VTAAAGDGERTVDFGDGGAFTLAERPYAHVSDRLWDAAFVLALYVRSRRTHERPLNIVEIGAGRGHWARALRDAGVAVEAYDDGSALPGRGAAVFPVIKGDGLAAVRNDPDAALLLVFPPPTPMAVNALDAFPGRVVLYAGEPRGGANGTDAFFGALDARYYVAAAVVLDPFPGGCEKLFVLRRRRRWLFW